MNSQLLPIKQLVVLLEFTSPVTTRFYHQPLLTAFLRHLSANHPDYENLITIDAPESGRLKYQTGDYYRFSIFGFQGSDPIVQYLIEQLQQLPLSAKKSDPALTFRNNLTHVRDFSPQKGQKHPKSRDPKQLFPLYSII